MRNRHTLLELLRGTTQQLTLRLEGLFILTTVLATAHAVAGCSPGNWLEVADALRADGYLPVIAPEGEYGPGQVWDVSNSGEMQLVSRQQITEQLARPFTLSDRAVLPGLLAIERQERFADRRVQLDGRLEFRNDPYGEVLVQETRDGKLRTIGIGSPMFRMLMDSGFEIHSVSIDPEFILDADVQRTEQFVRANTSNRAPPRVDSERFVSTQVVTGELRVRLSLATHRPTAEDDLNAICGWFFPGSILTPLDSPIESASASDLDPATNTPNNLREQRRSWVLRSSGAVIGIRLEELRPTHGATKHSKETLP